MAYDLTVPLTPSAHAISQYATTTDNLSARIALHVGKRTVLITAAR
ncbi:hypothetical protein [Nonomuraea sp. NPDC049141]